MELWRDWVNDWELKSQTRGGKFARKSLGNVTQVIFHTRVFSLQTTDARCDQSRWLVRFVLARLKLIPYPTTTKSTDR
jgi:hypothetical protein